MGDALPSNRLTAAFERRAREALNARVDRRAAVVVACSGGPDSTAALIAVARSRGAGRRQDHRGNIRPWDPS